MSKLALNSTWPCFILVQKSVNAECLVQTFLNLFWQWFIQLFKNHKYNNCYKILCVHFAMHILDKIKFRSNYTKYKKYMKKNINVTNIMVKQKKSSK